MTKCVEVCCSVLNKKHPPRSRRVTPLWHCLFSSPTYLREICQISAGIRSKYKSFGACTMASSALHKKVRIVSSQQEAAHLQQLQNHNSKTLYMQNELCHLEGLALGVSGSEHVAKASRFRATSLQ